MKIIIFWRKCIIYVLVTRIDFTNRNKNERRLCVCVVQINILWIIYRIFYAYLFRENYDKVCKGYNMNV